MKWKFKWLACMILANTMNGCCEEQNKDWTLFSICDVLSWLTFFHFLFFLWHMMGWRDSKYNTSLQFRETWTTLCLFFCFGHWLFHLSTFQFDNSKVCVVPISKSLNQKGHWKSPSCYSSSLQKPHFSKVVASAKIPISEPKPNTPFCCFLCSFSLPHFHSINTHLLKETQIN